MDRNSLTSGMTATIGENVASRDHSSLILHRSSIGQAGSSTVREHSADIRATVVRLHLGLLTTIRREKERPLRLKRSHSTDN